MLQKLTPESLHNPSSTNSWPRLFGFSTACLAKPSRGEKSHNLTTNIVKQIRQYEVGSVSAPEVPRQSSAQSKMSKLTKSCDQQIATMAAAKLEDGDVKGAIRLLCSDDCLAIPDAVTFAELSRLHPPAPSTDMPPLRVTPVEVKIAIQSFPNGSAADPDGLRPQHLKVLLLGAADNSPLLVAISDLVNVLLDGKTPNFVRGTIFGANLIASSKKNGGVRPIAVGHVWRRLAAKVPCNNAKDSSATLLAPRQLVFGVPGGAEAAV
jgi:hypothetical protein